MVGSVSSGRRSAVVGRPPPRLPVVRRWLNRCRPALPASRCTPLARSGRPVGSPVGNDDRSRSPHRSRRAVHTPGEPAVCDTWPSRERPRRRAQCSGRVLRTVKTRRNSQRLERDRQKISWGLLGTRELPHVTARGCHDCHRCCDWEVSSGSVWFSAGDEGATPASALTERLPEAVFCQRGPSVSPAVTESGLPTPDAIPGRSVCHKCRIRSTRSTQAPVQVRLEHGQAKSGQTKAVQIQASPGWVGPHHTRQSDQARLGRARSCQLCSVWRCWRGDESPGEAERTVRDSRQPQWTAPKLLSTTKTAHGCHASDSSASGARRPTFDVWPLTSGLWPRWPTGHRLQFGS